MKVLNVLDEWSGWLNLVSHLTNRMWRMELWTDRGRPCTKWLCGLITWDVQMWSTLIRTTNAIFEWYEWQFKCIKCDPAQIWYEINRVDSDVVTIAGTRSLSGSRRMSDCIKQPFISQMQLIPELYGICTKSKESLRVCNFFSFLSHLSQQCGTRLDIRKLYLGVYNEGSKNIKLMFVLVHIVSHFW